MKTIMAVPKKKIKKIVKKKVSAKGGSASSRKKTIVRRVAVRKIAKRKKGVLLKRAIHNPIIEPRAYTWESKATFNPTAFLAHKKVNLVYRAIGDNDSSMLGYAGSYDGYNIIERPTYAIFQRSGHFHRPDFSVSPIDYVSGGGWNGGCEDPRVTLLDDVVYMLYTAFDGWGSVRIALTSIKLDDFEHKKWNWKNPVLISPPNEIHKNWVIFPEKINGKFAILHSLSPQIMVDYFDSLDEFDGKKFINSVHMWDPRWQLREKGMRGVGPAPIKTELGWLILFHAIEEHDPDRYKLFAMILDSKNPTKILYRSESPILEPEEYYENEGYKWGVVYSCGAVVKDGTLFVYYGGADKVIGVASIKLTDLLLDLKKHKAVKLQKQVTSV